MMVLYEHLHVAPSDQRRIHKALLSQGYALLADVGLWRGQPANRLYGRRFSKKSPRLGRLPPCGAPTVEADTSVGCPRLHDGGRR